MTLDLTKPMRLTYDGRPVQFLHKLKKRHPGIDRERGALYIVIVTDNNDEETCYVYSETQLENIPESRWLNVYVNVPIPPNWCNSRIEADSASGGHPARIAIIEDKQDGSPWILHQL